MALGLRSLVVSLVGVLAATLCGGALAVTQIGFALDRSGNVALSDFDLQADGLSAALAAVPTDGSVEVTVVSYASSVTTVIPPTIVTAANIANIVATVAAESGGSGGTRTDLAIDELTALMTGSPVFAAADTTSLINVSTDGAPNSQSLTEAAGVNANAAGIDFISFEAVGSGVSSTTASVLV
ncbi:MAG: VWA domain-containing protein [Burkholderiaceae bacterium]